MVKSGIYKHYKGKYYFVLGVAQCSETDGVYVVYVPLYTVSKSNKYSMFVRPIKMFTGSTYINTDDPPNTKRVKRFTYIGQTMKE